MRQPPLLLFLLLLLLGLMSVQCLWTGGRALYRDDPASSSFTSESGDGLVQSVMGSWTDPIDTDSPSDAQIADDGANGDIDVISPARGRLRVCFTVCKNGRCFRVCR